MFKLYTHVSYFLVDHHVTHLGSIMNDSRPSFDSLPLRKDGPHGNAWGRFGEKDELGMLNLLTPGNTKAAAKEIVDGVRISTDWPLDRISNPMFGRAQFSHTIDNKAPKAINDDSLSFNTQISSQWDGFRHYAYQKEQLYFNGRTPKDITNTKENGIHGLFFCLQGRIDHTY